MRTSYLADPPRSRRRTLARRAGVVAAALTAGASLLSGVGATVPIASAIIAETLMPVTRAFNGDGDSTPGLPAPPRPHRVRPMEQAMSAVTAGTRSAKKASAKALAAAAPVSGKGAPGAGPGKTLVLYDSTGPYAWLGEAYAMQTANLVSHFTAWTARPVTTYTAGEMSGYTGVVYIGSTYDEPLPVSFLDDVSATSIPVIWMYDNIWELTARKTDFAANRGFTYKEFDLAAVAKVNYKGRTLSRDTQNGSGIMDVAISDPTKAKVMAEAVRPDGTTFPWAVRSGNFTYVGEIPFAYVTHDDRYLAFSDLLFDSFAPATKERHRALVRIEDVGPDADPAELKAIADYLYSQRVPFSVAVYARYRDPNGVHTNGKAEDYTLAQRPQVVSALKYMQARGGTMLMHGYTHQFGNLDNPYDGVSANDFEFYRAHVDAQDRVIYDGPVPGDSTAMATGRMMAAKTEFARAGLTQPTIFEFPHYAASAADYRAVQTVFGKRYERALMFPGVLSGGAIDYTRPLGQFFPFLVRDVYGSAVVPENIGNVEPDAFNHHPARLPADLIASADRNLVIRDGMASFFYHPYLGTDYLKQLVPGIKAKGYTFVTASAMLAG